MTLTESDAEELDLLSLLPMIYSLVITGSNIKGHDITRMQLILMLALSRQNQLLMSRVAQYMSSSREQATRAVDHLVKDGYVQRLPDATNRTHVLISLTDKGTEVLKQCHRDFGARIHENVSDKLSQDEMASLRNHISEVIRLLDKVV